MRAAIGLLLVATFAYAGPKEDAKAHIANAQEAMQSDRFDDALVELKAAYKLDPDFNLLFAIGQVYVQLGRCGEASAHYDRFLARTKDARAASVVAQALAACREKATEPPPPPPPDEPAATSTTKTAAKNEQPPPASQPPTAPKSQSPTAPKSQPPATKSQRPMPPMSQPPTATKPRAKSDPPRAEPRRTSVASAARASSPAAGTQTDEGGRRWYSDKIGGALVITGVASGIVGGVLYANARSDARNAGDERTHPEYVAALEDASGKRNTSIVLFVAAAGLVTAGILRYSLVVDDEPDRIGVAPMTNGGLVTWGGRF